MPSSTRSPARIGRTDFVFRAIAYAEDAAGDRSGARYGLWIRLAARRFLKDLKRAAGRRPPFLWSPAQANKACAFIELLPHVEGVWDSPSIRLCDAHVFLVVQLFGFRRPDGGRRFARCLLATARKNAKSTIAAGILLYLLAEEPEVGPQVVAAATTGDQARVVWKIAARMIDRLPALREHYGIEAFANSIVRYANGGSFRPINAKASTQDGLNPSAVCLDEVHAHKNHDLYNVLLSAAGARANPLFLFCTTEGYETPGPWPELREFSKRVLQGVVPADHFLALIFAVDDKDDDFDERAWPKANPLFSENPMLLRDMRQLATEAREMPGRLAEFRIKRLNRQASSARGWINLTKWKRCGQPVLPDQLLGSPCWGGIDLASSQDMASCWWLWRKGGHYFVWGRYWVPEEAVSQRTQRGSVPYQAWAEAGLVQVVPGDVLDYAVVEADILADWQRFLPAKVAYDPWNASDLVNRLVGHGLPMVKFIQGPQSYHPAMQELERLYVGGRLSHGNHPVLTWNAANLITRRNVNMNLAPDKSRSPDKIDGMCSVLMALGVALVDGVEAGDPAGFFADPVRA